MAVSHIFTSPVADMTGTVTVFNSLGATVTTEATALVRPSNWNSVHNQYYTLTGNTNNASTASGTNVVLSGGNGVTLIGSNSQIGLSVNTSYRASNDAIGLNTAQTNVTWTVNSGGLSFNAGGYAGTTTGFTGGSISGSMTHNTLGLAVSLSHPAWLTTAAQSDHSHGNPTLALTNLSGTTASNSAGLTLSLSAQAPGAATLTAYAVSNTTQSTSGTIPGSVVSFQGNGGVSVGVSNGSVVVSGPALTSLSVTGALSASSNGSTISLGVGTVTAYATSNTTGASSATIDLGSIVVRGAGIVSAGVSAGTIIVSASAAGAADGYNLIAAGTQTANTTGTVVFSNSNGITFGMSNSSIVTASHNGITQQSTQPVAVSGQNGSYAFSTLSFSNANGVSFGTSAGSALTASVAAQTNQTVGLYHVGNTTGQSSSSTVDARSISFDGAGIVSVGMSAGSVLISATQSNQAFSAGAASSTFQTLTLQDSNGVSFSNNAGAIRVTHDLAGTATAITGGASMTVNSGGISFNGTALAGTGTTFAGANISASMTLNSNGLNLSASVAAPGAAAENNAINLLGANTAGNTTATGSTIGWSGLNITLSGTNASQVVVSAPATSSLSATGQVSISTNGSTISIGVPSAFTKSGHFPYADMEFLTGNVGQGSLLVEPETFPAVQFDRILAPIFNSNASNSSGSHTISSWFGIYTRNASTLSLLTSVSTSLVVTHSGTQGSYSLYSGIRHVVMPLTTTLSQGQYWVGQVSRTTSGGANGTYANVVLSGLNSVFVGYWSSAHNTTMQSTLGQGIYTATTSGMPASIGFSEIRGSDSNQYRSPVYGFASSTV